jgi:hypothetical protein
MSVFASDNEHGIRCDCSYSLLYHEYRMCPRHTEKSQFEKEMSHSVPGVMKLGASRQRIEYMLLQFLLYIYRVVSSASYFLS